MRTNYFIFILALIGFATIALLLIMRQWPAVPPWTPVPPTSKPGLNTTDGLPPGWQNLTA